jgi:type III secretion protein L
VSRLFSLIFDKEVHTSSGKKSLAAEDFSTLLEAVEILEKAKEEAQAYRNKVEEECVQLKEQAKRDGFQEGLGQLNDQILALDQEKKRLRHEMNKLILPLALKAAKKIVAKELETHPETIVDIVMHALTPVLQNHRITIYINKGDREILEAEKPKIREKLEQVESFVIKERDDIAPGGCIIETESGIINAAIENQWRALESAFERYTKL